MFWRRQNVFWAFPFYSFPYCFFQLRSLQTDDFFISIFFCRHSESSLGRRNLNVFSFLTAWTIVPSCILLIPGQWIWENRLCLLIVCLLELLRNRPCFFIACLLQLLNNHEQFGRNLFMVFSHIKFFHHRTPTPNIN